MGLGQDALHLLEIGPAAAVEVDAPAPSLELLGVQMLFQGADPVADGGGGDVELLAGQHEALVPGGGLEEAQAFERGKVEHGDGPEGALWQNVIMSSQHIRAPRARPGVTRERRAPQPQRKDLATMEIVGWSMSERLKSVLCEEALKMAIRSRRLPMGLIHHSDRGVQYACGDYRKLLRLHGIKASMSRRGNCLDNAPMESFFGSLKTELAHRTRFSTRREAKAALFEYIEIFYNQRRRHSSIGYRTPAQARRDMTIAQAA